MFTKRSTTKKVDHMIKYFILLLLLPFTLLADPIVWNTATEREDGTILPASEIAGHNIYYSDGTPGVYPNILWVPMPSLTGVVPKGNGFDRQVVVTTVDTDNRESAFSLEVTVIGEVVIIADPNPPSNVRIQATEPLPVIEPSP